MGFIHHLSKSGEIYGSEYLRNRARVVFSADPSLGKGLVEDTRMLEVTLSKANDVKYPQTFYFDVEDDGSVWPSAFTAEEEA